MKFKKHNTNFKIESGMLKNARTKFIVLVIIYFSFLYSLPFSFNKWVSIVVIRCRFSRTNNFVSRQSILISLIIKSASLLTSVFFFAPFRENPNRPTTFPTTKVTAPQCFSVFKTTTRTIPQITAISPIAKRISFVWSHWRQFFIIFVLLVLLLLTTLKRYLIIYKQLYK